MTKDIVSLPEQELFHKNDCSRYTYKIIGATSIHYISDNLTQCIKYVLYCKNKYDEKIEIIIGINMLHMKHVTQFENITMVPNKKIFINIQLFYNSYFFDPYEELINNITIFNKTMKHKDLRPIWIYGGSCEEGIDFFKESIKSFSIDKNEILPDIIACDTIIIGTSGININDIKKRCIGNNEYIFVGFENIIKKEHFLPKYGSAKNVYIFTGDKYLGKRHIAYNLNKKITNNKIECASLFYNNVCFKENKIEPCDVYETKGSSVLPNKMNHDIVIISPDSKFTYLDIIEKYNGNYNFISIHFSKIQ